jgi:hypothetical protein
VVELTNLGETPIGTLIQCDIRDAHLDNGKTRLQFQGGDGVFRPMAAVPGKANVFCIPYEAVCSGLVRATAEDLANNQAFREEHLNNMRNSQKAAANSDRKGTIPTNPIQTVGASGGPIMMDKMTPQRMPKGNGFEIVQRSPQDGPTLPIGAGAKSTPRPDGTDGPRWLVQTKHETTEAGQTEVGVIPPLTNVNAHVAKAAHTAAAATAVKRQITAKNKVFLEYQIENAGLSGVGKVEAWITRDKGQSWHKVGEESNSKNPLEMHLPGEGLFGVTLVASNGRGVVGRPPATGDTPDGWIEVDTTKPFAQITNVKSATEDGKSVVHIHWTVTDKNLGDAPVDLFYGPTPQGIWLPIAKGLKADGQHRWTPPVEIGPQAHLRLIATDLAGNIGIASTLEPVLFDDPARPRAVIRNILTSMPPSSIVPARSADPTPPHIVQPPPMPQ